MKAEEKKLCPLRDMLPCAKKKCAFYDWQGCTLAAIPRETRDLHSALAPIAREIKDLRRLADTAHYPSWNVLEGAVTNMESTLKKALGVEDAAPPAPEPKRKPRAWLVVLLIGAVLVAVWWLKK